MSETDKQPEQIWMWPTDHPDSYDETAPDNYDVIILHDTGEYGGTEYTRTDIANQQAKAERNKALWEAREACIAAEDEADSYDEMVGADTCRHKIKALITDDHPAEKNDD